MVMNADGKFIEVQGAAESQPFGRSELDRLLKLAFRGIGELLVVLGLAVAAAGQVSQRPSLANPLYLPIMVKDAGGASIAGCPQLPVDNIWNVRVDRLPVDSHSQGYITSIGENTRLHPDFGTVWQGEPIGIPYNIVPGSQPGVQVTFTYDDESDHALYPIPTNPLIEGGPNASGDRHILIIDRDHCKLYELYDARPRTDGSWQAGSGAIFDLYTNALRPAGWTSADAAGLPILPGLVRYDEVTAGAIRHAVRFTAAHTQMKYVWPARHYASQDTSLDLPPMGQRFRLKAAFDISGFSPQVRVILQAFKTYGLILADNGSNWYISGAPDTRWDDPLLVSEFGKVPGSAFEGVDVSSLMVDPDSGQAKGP